ncbi:MAG: M14 family metallopeptidase [Bacteroidales bacterium]|nr:M14 family metallopeptidase [Bacteroidales bacterium]
MIPNSLKIKILIAGVLAISFSSEIYSQDLLPAARKWTGKSETLIALPVNQWITPIEKSDFTITPGYSECISWLSGLCSASPLLSIDPVGISPENRTIYMITASTGMDKSPRGLKNSGKPSIMVMAGIHAGEIDGKDAGMMLLRDIAFGGYDSLLTNCNLIFIPIINVDGHERSSPYNRINQRGPENMGWRTNAQNLNLNRDFAKLDTREIRAVVKIMNDYDPDLFIDIHVSDGIDYQYDITMGSMATHGYSPISSQWLRDNFYPEIYRNVRKMGHCPGPLMFSFNDKDYKDGLVEYSSGPSFSDNYADLRHLPSVLIENHSLKPYKQRVLATRVFLAAAMDLMGKEGVGLKEARNEDCHARDPLVPIGFQIPQFKGIGMFGNIPADKQTPTTPPDSITILGISSERLISDISGGEYVHWTGNPLKIRTAIYRMNEPVGFIELPKAYWIPAAWKDVIERLRLHGIQMEVLSKPVEVRLEMYRITNPVFDKTPNENHMKVHGIPVPEIRTETLAAGSVKISCDQPLAELAALLLDPNSANSFLQWGFFNSIFSRTEYAEDYALEPLARQMLSESEELRIRFEEKKAKDTVFASDPAAILRWFYMQSPYYDQRYLLYPVGREID